MSNLTPDLSNQHKKIRKKRKRSNQSHSDTPSNLTNQSPVLKKKRRKRKRTPEKIVEKSSLVGLSDQIADKASKSFMDLNQDSSNTMFESDINKSKQRKNRNRGNFLGIVLIAICLLFFFSYYYMSQVKVPNFIDKPITDVTKWAKENEVKIDIKNVYSSTVDSDKVLKQNPAMSKKIKKGSYLSVTISQGADPDEHIELPDFSLMTETQLKKFIKKNKIENITIKNEYSETIKKGNVIKIEFDDKKVTPSTYQRKDNLIIYLSLGENIEANQVLIPDFSSKTKADIDSWAKQNNISVTYDEVDSEKPKGSFIQMSSTEQYIPKNSHITVGISNGKLEKQSEDNQSLSQEATDLSRIEIKGKG